MTKLLFALALSLFAGTASAQTFGTNNAASGPGWLSYDNSGNLKVTGSAGGPVPQVTGFGTLAATNSSTLLSTLTTGPNSAAWPASPGQIYVINQSTSPIYICPLGGTCAAATGMEIMGGQAYGFYKPSMSMTVIAPSTATVQAQW